MSRPSAEFDILMVTDCRFPGGNSSSVVEEIQAQQRAGYRTGLLHIPSTVLTYPRPFNPKIRKVLDRGDAELVLAVDRIQTRLLLARHPSIFTSPPPGLPEIDAEEVVLAVNQVPTDPRGGRAYYDVQAVDREMQQRFGRRALWAPIGPRVRDAFAEEARHVRFSEEDWENVIDVAAWRYERAGFVGDRPVIGRHSRGHWSKWPDTREDLLAAYPDDPAYVVSILGGAATPRQLLGGRLPSNWIDHPFNSIPAQEYLRGIDFLVYYHHPGLIEAFGRVVLEGIAAGAVGILPPYLERLFGDVCLYGTPQDVRSHIDQLYGDEAAFLERSKRGIELAESRYSYATHLRRIDALIGGPPQPTEMLAEPQTPESPSPPVSIEPKDPLALVVDLRPDTEDDGLTRRLADALGPQTSRTVIAERWSGRAQQHRYPVETFANLTEGISPKDRVAYLHGRFEGLRRDHRPASIVLIDDGTDLAQRLAAITTADGLEALVIQRGTISPRDASDLRPTATAILDALPTGWRLVPDPVAHVTPSGSGSERPPGLVGNVKWLYWRLGRQLRRARRWIIKVARSSKPLARPAANAVRAAGHRLIHGAVGRQGLSLVPLPRTPVRLSGQDWVTHPDPASLPRVLVVVPESASAPPEPFVRQLVERQQMSSGFRLSLLAPSPWMPAATRYGLAAEALLPREDWTIVHGAGWEEHLRRRIQDTRALFGATAVLLLDLNEISVTLAALEASGHPDPQD